MSRRLSADSEFDDQIELKGKVYQHRNNKSNAACEVCNSETVSAKLRRNSKRSDFHSNKSPSKSHVRWERPMAAELDDSINVSEIKPKQQNNPAQHRKDVQEAKVQMDRLETLIRAFSPKKVIKTMCLALFLCSFFFSLTILPDCTFLWLAF